MIHYLDSDKYKHQSEWFEQAKLVYNSLPKHSESFGEWKVDQTEHSLRFQGQYFLFEYTHNPAHTVFFTIVLSKDPEKSFNLQFNGKNSQELSRRFRLRGYLESEIIESLYGDPAGVELLISSGYLNGLDE
tara:strand:- start:1868 stop:2260 length:393 start_codon:yes stop_codon:yes gene_type:complete